MADYSRKPLALANPLAHLQAQGSLSQGSIKGGVGLHLQTDPKKVLGAEIKGARGDLDARWGPDGARIKAEAVQSEGKLRVGGRDGDVGELAGSCHLLKGGGEAEVGRHRLGAKLEGSIAGCEAKARLGSEDNNVTAGVKAGLGAGASFGMGCKTDKNGQPVLTGGGGVQLGLGVKGNFSSTWLGQKLCPALPSTAPETAPAASGPTAAAPTPVQTPNVPAATPPPAPAAAAPAATEAPKTPSVMEEAAP